MPCEDCGRIKVCDCVETGFENEEIPRIFMFVGMGFIGFGLYWLIPAMADGYQILDFLNYFIGGVAILVGVFLTLMMILFGRRCEV